MEHDSFTRFLWPLKVVRKAEEQAFFNKAKIVDIYIPSKVKKYIQENLNKEINHFKKKYKLDFNISSDENLIIPEYRIDLLNKNKKIIKKVENIEKIEKHSFKQNYDRKNFMMKKNNKKFKSKGKFKKKFGYHSKIRKNNFENKKIVSY